MQRRSRTTKGAAGRTAPPPAAPAPAALSAAAGGTESAAKSETAASRLHRPSELETLEAWDNLRDAINRVECALPSQMSAAIERLIQERRKFDDLLLGRQRAPSES